MIQVAPRESNADSLARTEKLERAQSFNTLCSRLGFNGIVDS